MRIRPLVTPTYPYQSDTSTTTRPITIGPDGSGCCWIRWGT